MNFIEMTEAMRDAHITLNLAKSHSVEMAVLLYPNLELCDPHTLRRIKRKLRRYNSNTGKWQS